MNDYYEVKARIEPCSEDAADLLAAMLGEAGFESFVPQPWGLMAYIPAESYDEDLICSTMECFPMPCGISWESKLIPGQDWNEEWEKNYFQPIVVKDGEKDSVVIHSSFHVDVPACQYDIVIDPKMAFGTGHHATTSQIISALLRMDLEGKSVIDMGTGTGILAILSAMLGALPVTAIEIDSFAYENAVENCRLNGHPEVCLINGDASSLNGIEPADVFIANINRNIITSDMAAYSAALRKGGAMILSGFFEEDIPIVCDRAESLGLRFVMATSTLKPDSEKRQISERPQGDGGSLSDCLPNTFGAVVNNTPDSPWACVTLIKE